MELGFLVSKHRVICLIEDKAFKSGLPNVIKKTTHKKYRDQSLDSDLVMATMSKLGTESSKDGLSDISRRGPTDLASRSVSDNRSLKAMTN